MITATSKLDAINIILSSIGSDPVNTINEEIDVDVANACRMLDRASRDIQRKGWDFNTYTLTLSPDQYTGKVPWIPTIISYRSTDGTPYVKRGENFYDIENQTFQFKQPIHLTAIMMVDFEDLPDAFKNYIAARAAMNFQTRYMGDTANSQDLALSVQEAYQDIVTYDMNMGDYNMLTYAGVTPALERS